MITHIEYVFVKAILMEFNITSQLVFPHEFMNWATPARAGCFFMNKENNKIQ